MTLDEERAEAIGLVSDVLTAAVAGAMAMFDDDANQPPDYVLAESMIDAMTPRQVLHVTKLLAGLLGGVLIGMARSRGYDPLRQVADLVEFMRRDNR